MKKICVALAACGNHALNTDDNSAMSCGGILTDENFYEGKEQQIYWINLQYSQF